MCKVSVSVVRGRKAGICTYHLAAYAASNKVDHPESVVTWIDCRADKRRERAVGLPCFDQQEQKQCLLAVCRG